MESILSPGITGRCYKQSIITQEGFDPAAYINGAHINMRPSTELLAEFKQRAKLQRVASTLMP